MPFGPYSDMDDCIKKNQEKKNPGAYCSYIHRQITGKWPGEMSAEDFDLDKFEARDLADFVEGLSAEAVAAYFEAFEGARMGGKNYPDSRTAANDAVHALGWQRRNERWVKKAELKLETKTVHGVEVFAAGEHKGDVYTLQDLDAMILAFSELKGKIDPPLKVGHSSDEFNRKLAEALGVPEGLVTGENGNGAMALGWISNLRRVGEILVADFVDVPEPLSDLIESRSYDKVSSEIIWNFEVEGKTYPKVLGAVALLGAELPAVTEIEGLETAAVYTFTAAPDAVIEFAKEGIKYEEIEPSLKAAGAALDKVIRNRPGASIIRALWNEVSKKAKEMLSKGRKHSQEITEEGEQMKELLKLLGLEENATEEAAIAVVQSLQAKVEEAGENGKMSLSELSTTLGLEDTADKEAVMAALTLLMEKAEAQPPAGTEEAKQEFANLQQKVTQLSESLDEEKAGRKHDQRIVHFTNVVKGWPAISADPKELAEKIVRLEETDEKAAEELCKQYKEMNDQLVGAGIFSPKGTPAEGEVDEHPFIKEVHKYAEEKHVEFHIAFDALRVEKPKDYTAYMKQRERP